MGFLSDLISNPIGALTGATAANRQTDRATAAANQQLDAALAAASGYLTPYLDPGVTAYRRLAAGVAPGGEFAGGVSGGDTDRFDPAAYAFRATGLPALGSPDIRTTLPNAGFTAPVAPFSAAGLDPAADPGYAFRLNQGLDAVERSAAARGKALSGEAVTALNDYAQNTASDEYQRAYDRALAENRLAYDRALGENQLAFDRGTRLSDLSYGRNADAFDRTLALNDLLYGRQQAENQTAYERALADSLRREQRAYTDDALRYGRLSDLLRLGYGAAGDLAGLASGTGLRQAGNVYNTGQSSADTTFAGFGRAYDTGFRLASLIPR
jgi:hypothetical protein